MVKRADTFILGDGVAVALPTEDHCAEGIHYPHTYDENARQWVCKCWARAVNTGLGWSAEAFMLTRRPVSQYAKWELPF